MASELNLPSLHMSLKRVSSLRPDFTSNLEQGLAFGTPKFYTAPSCKINDGIVNLSYTCNRDVKSGLRADF